MFRVACLFVCAIGLSVAGCGTQEEAASSNPTGSRMPDDNVFKDQVRALEKAEDVRNVLDDAAAKQREQIERVSQ